MAEVYQEPPKPTGTYPILGIPLVEGQPIPVRREITDWYNDASNKYQVSLFMQAMTDFKKVEIKERLSYFQIAGIHSYPLVGWDGEAKAPDPAKDQEWGYCAHNKVTFPVWHRPYLLLYEQVIHKHMKEILEKWGMKDEDNEWTRAASSFRLPYWDWARLRDQGSGGKPVVGMPQVCTLDNVEIILPGNKTTTIENPLKDFKNPSGIPMGDSKMGDNRIKPNGTLPWDKCVATSRYGIQDDVPEDVWVKGVNNWKAVDGSLQAFPWYKKVGGTLTEAVGRMFSAKFSSYEQFASTKWNNPPPRDDKNPPGPDESYDFLSIEYIHNVVHNASGGQFMNWVQQEKALPAWQPMGLGHMSDVPVSAFDPIFWFHHCNIDRLFAIWQTLNPDKWFDAPQPGDPGRDKPLFPFHFTENGDRWFPDKCQKTTELRYQYDDIYAPKGTPIPPSDPNYLVELKQHINELYPSTGTVVKATPGLMSDEGEYDDYVINVLYDRYALGGLAYSIVFYLGGDPASGGAYGDKPVYVGQVYTFSQPTENDGETTCANCADQQASGVMCSAQVSLTLPIFQAAEAVNLEPASGGDQQALGFFSDDGALDLSPDKVYAVLKRELKWIYVAIGGEVIPETRFPNNKIRVYYGRPKYTDDDAVLDEFPSGAYNPLKKPRRGIAEDADDDDETIGTSAWI